MAIKRKTGRKHLHTEGVLRLEFPMSTKAQRCKFDKAERLMFALIEEMFPGCEVETNYTAGVLQIRGKG
jgi:hypothetical protein